MYVSILWTDTGKSVMMNVVIRSSAVGFTGCYAAKIQQPDAGKYLIDRIRSCNVLVRRLFSLMADRDFRFGFSEK